ncbi:hypothetical protein [Bradyrhizobium cytisi]|uniref:hypothetical protein n=1 Tax=Bradyrhizobium cytisi TaxID=515489 RepID=UPI001FE8DD43|nr:hypothetical protein [Bradyrhizobium cytisi]
MSGEDLVLDRQLRAIVADGNDGAGDVDPRQRLCMKFRRPGKRRVIGVAPSKPALLVDECSRIPQGRSRRREFAEELGPSASIGLLRTLGEIRQRGGKRVIAFAGEGHFDPAVLTSNTFDIEWPPRSGRRQSFPEVDRADWFDIEFARTKMLSGQVEFLDRLLEIAVESAGK